MRRHRRVVAVGCAFVALLLLSSLVAWALYMRSQESLWESYRTQARLHRTGGQAGQRFDTLGVLADAAAIRPSIELRNEAIAALALPDLKLLKQWDVKPDGHTGIVFSNDHRQFAAFDNLGDVRVRRVADGADLLHLPPTGEDTRVNPQFSPDGTFLVRACKSGYEVWDVGTAMRIHEFPARPIPYSVPSFSPDCRELAVGAPDGILIYDVDSGPQRVLPHLGAVHNRVWFHPKLPIIATASQRDKDVLIRRSDTGELLHSLPHPENVWCAAWNGSGTRLATSCYDLHVRVWSATTGEVTLNVTGHVGLSDYVSFDATGNALMSSGWDGLTCFWDSRTGQRILTVQGEELGRSFSNSGSLLGMFWKRASRWDAAIVDFQEGLVSILVGSPGPAPERRATRAIVLAIDGRLAVAAAIDGLRLWDLEDRRELAYLPIGRIEAVFFPPSQDQLITSGPGGVYHWPLTLEDGTVRLGPPRQLNIRPWAGGSGCASLSADGKRLAVGLRERRFAILELPKADPAIAWGDQNRLMYVAISPDASWIATSDWGAADDGGTRVWNAADGNLVTKLPEAPNSRLAFSPDGDWLIASNREASWFWEVGTWALRHRFTRENAGVPGVIAYSPDGRYLALQDRRTTIQLYDALTFELLASLEPPDGSHIKAAAFTPDGAQLVCGTEKSYLLHVWDLRRIRQELSGMNLDWDMTPYKDEPAKEKSPAPLHLEVDLGALAARTSASPKLATTR